MTANMVNRCPSTTVNQPRDQICWRTGRIVLPATTVSIMWTTFAYKLENLEWFHSWLNISKLFDNRWAKRQTKMITSSSSYVIKKIRRYLPSALRRPLFLFCTTLPCIQSSIPSSTPPTDVQICIKHLVQNFVSGNKHSCPEPHYLHESTSTQTLMNVT